jgi:hypothetical protein
MRGGAQDEKRDFIPNECHQPPRVGARLLGLASLALTDKGVGPGGESRLLAGIQLADEDNDDGRRAGPPAECSKERSRLAFLAPIYGHPLRCRRNERHADEFHGRPRYHTVDQHGEQGRDLQDRSSRSRGRCGQRLERPQE